MEVEWELHFSQDALRRIQKQAEINFCEARSVDETRIAPERTAVGHERCQLQPIDSRASQRDTTKRHALVVFSTDFRIRLIPRPMPHAPSCVPHHNTGGTYFFKWHFERLAHLTRTWGNGNVECISENAFSFEETGFQVSSMLWSSSVVLNLG